ncbi:HAMP domain-containing histidine kinase [Erysipelothrix sp. HDW6B]|uniref:HAMP domain-containing sensor histidine kinase n=1 Tax=Erysipelothrix sp. HDW6B TaxID=2714929 RepID=UPI00140E7226|nr:HAMP domain-containing sensor histidine kinase [Erysipelothrix sp. HDW6B]QIK86504.1 HAMP domain-containing histidine kinase [Erysipelothrix sp. HDW6B]
MKYFKNLKLFPKTFALTLITILTTIMVFAFGFKFMYTSYINSFLDKQFNSSVSQVQNMLETSSMDNLILNNKLIEFERSAGVYIVVTDAYRNVVYPYTGGIYLPALETAPTQIISSDVNISASVVGTTSTARIKEFQFLNAGNVYTARIASNTGIDNEMFSSIFFSVMPYMVIVGLIVSALISYIYARYTAHKIIHLNHIMEKMESFQYVALDAPVRGDEIATLENQIDHLYKRLMHEMDTIQKFEKDRDIFMKGSIHELKTPLMVMSLYIEELMHDEELPSNYQEIIYELNHKLVHMNALINETLKVSRLESIRDIPILNVNEPLETVQALYHPMLVDNRQQLDLEITSSTVPMSELDFSRVTSNLIGNAIRYGTVDSTIKMILSDTVLSVSNVYEGAWDDSVNLCAPFTSMGQHDDSHGLGLYVVSMILNKYNYSYNYLYDSREHCFTFTIFLK